MDSKPVVFAAQIDAKTRRRDDSTDAMDAMDATDAVAGVAQLVEQLIRNQ